MHLCNEPEYKDDASCNPDINPAIPDCPQAGPEVCGEPEIGEEMVVEDDTSPPDDEENEDEVKKKAKVKASRQKNRRRMMKKTCNMSHLQFLNSGSHIFDICGRSFYFGICSS